MSQIESGDAKLLAYRSEIVASHASMLISMIHCGETLSAEEEQTVRDDVHTLRAVAARVARRCQDGEGEEP